MVNHYPYLKYQKAISLLRTLQSIIYICLCAFFFFFSFGIVIILHFSFPCFLLSWPHICFSQISFQGSICYSFKNSISTDVAFIPVYSIMWKPWKEKITSKMSFLPEPYEQTGLNWLPSCNLNHFTDHLWAKWFEKAIPLLCIQKNGMTL